MMLAANNGAQTGSKAVLRDETPKQVVNARSRDGSLRS